MPHVVARELADVDERPALPRLPVDFLHLRIDFLADRPHFLLGGTGDVLHGTSDALFGAVLLEGVAVVLHDGEDIPVAQSSAVEQWREYSLRESVASDAGPDGA